MSDYITRTDEYIPIGNTLSNYRAIIDAAIDEDTYGFIYLITCNGKYYVGLTAQNDKYSRVREHVLYGSGKSCRPWDNSHLYNSIKKYGIENTLFKVIDTTATSQIELNKLEQKYIKHYKCDDREYGYNKTKGGEGTTGFKQSEEQKKETSDRMTDFFSHPENIEKQSIRISQYYKNNPNAGPEHGDRLRQIHKNNPEIAKSLSVKKKTFLKNNPDFAKQQGDKLKKKYNDEPELRNKMSMIKKEFYENNPDIAKQHGDKMKKKYNDEPELRDKMSVKKKEYFAKNPDAGKQHGNRLREIHKNNPEIAKSISVKKKEYYAKNPLAKYTHNKKPFNVYIKETGVHFGRYDYQGLARDALINAGCSPNVKISEALSGKRKPYSCGYIFKYVETDTTNEETSPV